MPSSLATLIDTKRVLLCVGSGGVGKTTLAAALGVAAAVRGRRVLVLTVDPAKRLANALGLKAFDEHVQHISIADLAAMGCPALAPLDASMLDVKRTFDRVVTRYAKSPETAQKILDHPFYQQASTALAGSQEYMATERLYECVTSGDYELVILDTPPSEHALDFLDAPRRLIDLFASPAFRKLIAPSSRVRTGVFRSGSVVMRGLQRFTSIEMFSNLLEFFGHLADTFDGFVERARQVQALLSGPDAAFVLVSACDAVSTDQAESLQTQLRAQGMEPSAWVVNRVLACDPALADADPALPGRIAKALVAIGADAAGGDASDAEQCAYAIANVARRFGAMAKSDAACVSSVTARHGADLTVLALPRRATEPDNLTELFAIGELLAQASQQVPAVA